MKTGYLIVEIPESCRKKGKNNPTGCPFGGMVCQICNTDVIEHVAHGTKPDWCPIKENI